MRPTFGLKLKTTTALVALLSAQWIAAAPASSADQATSATTNSKQPEDLEWMGAPSSAPKDDDSTSTDFINDEMDAKFDSASFSKKKTPSSLFAAKKDDDKNKSVSDEETQFGDDNTNSDEEDDKSVDPLSADNKSKDLDSLFASSSKPAASASSPFNSNKKNLMDTKLAQDEETEYTVIIKTGDRFGSGTNSHVFVQFGDGQGNAVNSFFSSRGHFSRRKVDSFKVKSSVHLDEICQLVVGHDNSHLYAPW